MIIPGHNNLFIRYIDEIESSIIRLLTDKPDDNSVKSIWDYIIQNWFYL